MSKTDAIRVIVGDGSRVDRDLVRFMLERDGFRVISSVAASEDLARAASVMQPDAVVLGEDLLDLEGAEAARLARQVSPDAKIVLFSALPAAAAAGPGMPDAVLERGIGLKDLTSTLNDLFKPAAAGTVATLPSAEARGAAARTTPLPVPPPPRADADEPSRRPIVVLAAAAAAMVMLIFVVARTFPVDRLTRRADASSSPSLRVAPSRPPTTSPSTTAASPSPAPAQQAQEHLTEAESYAQDLAQAIRGGDSLDATRAARDLIEERAAAAAAGASTSALDALNESIQQTLAPVAGVLSPELSAVLRVLLGESIAPTPTTGQESPAPRDGGGGDASGPPPSEEPAPSVTTPPTPEPVPGGTVDPVPGGDPGDDGSGSGDADASPPGSGWGDADTVDDGDDQPPGDFAEGTSDREATDEEATGGEAGASDSNAPSEWEDDQEPAGRTPDDEASISDEDDEGDGDSGESSQDDDSADADDSGDDDTSPDGD